MSGRGRARALGARTIGAVAVLVALAAGACAARPVLRWPGDGSAGIALSDAGYERPRSIGSIELCLATPGTATITSVAVHEASGDIRVEAFAVRPNPFPRGLDGLGASSTALAEVGGGFDPGARQQVTAVCPTDAQLRDPTFTPDLPELGVQVSWSSGALAGGDALEVRYVVDGVEQAAVIPFGIWLCAAACPEDVGWLPAGRREQRHERSG